MIHTLFRATCRAAAVALLAAGAAAAQTTGVRGLVVNAETGEPIPATMVRVLELGRSELSHQDGVFHFDRIPAGTYRIAAQRLGYAPAEQTVRVPAGATATVRIALSPTAIAIPGLVVTGTGQERSADDVYRPTSVLDDAELRRRLSSSIAATLTHEPGIAQRYNGPAAAQPVIRGLSGDRVLVLEDGQRTGDVASTSADHAVTIEPLTAERIEVLRGPAGLLYGSNALGGVINVVREEVPRSLPEAVTGTFSAQAESVNRGLTAGGSVSGAVGHVALRGELSGRRASDTGTPLGPLPSTQLAGYNTALGASWIGGGGFAGAALRDFGITYGVPGSFGGEAIPGAHEGGVTIEARRSTARAEAALHTGTGPFSAVELEGQYVRFVQDEIEQSGSVGTSFGQLTASGNLMAHHRHEAWSVLTEGTLGGSVLWQDLAVAGATGGRPARQLSLAGFVFEELELRAFRLQVGGRYDWTRVTPLDTRPGLAGAVRTRDFGALSGSVAGLLEPWSGVVLGASVSRAFRTPSITELFSNGPHLADYSFNIGNPELEPEYGLGTDLFARLRLAQLSGEVAVYRNQISNYIFYAPTGRLDPRLGRFPVYRASGEDAVLTGAEGHLQWAPVPSIVLDGTASYVLGSRSDAGEPLPAIPPLRAALDARLDRPRYFVAVGWEGVARQNRVGEFERPTGGYSLWNSGVGLRWTAWGDLHTLTLQLRNLTDALAYDHLSRLKEVAPQPGRSAELLYRMSF